MKHKDIILISFVVIVSGIFSYIVTSYLFASPKDRQEQVEVVEKITTDFPEPDKRYFNNESVNPTQTIRIGEGTNASPFNPAN